MRPAGDSASARDRFVELSLAAADAAGLPDDPAFREALRSHVEFGSLVAMQTRTLKPKTSSMRCVKCQNGRGPADESGSHRPRFLTCGFGASVQVGAGLPERCLLAPWPRVRDRLM